MNWWSKLFILCWTFVKETEGGVIKGEKGLFVRECIKVSEKAKEGPSATYIQGDGTPVGGTLHT